MKVVNLPTLEIKASNHGIIMAMEHLRDNAVSTQMKKHLTEVLAEICEDFNYCPDCLMELDWHSDFDRGYKSGWQCSVCSRKYGVV